MQARRVNFEVDGVQVVADLFLPEEPGPHPGLVFDGPLTSVKEQVQGHYARALAARGFVTIALDHRHFGESGGEPRQYEHPGRKVQDLRAAIDLLTDLDVVDPARIGAVGVCAGAGYLARAVAEDPRIRGFGVVAGFFHDVAQQRQWMGDDAFDAAVAEARAARERFDATGTAEHIPAVAEDGERAMPMDEAFAYYGTDRGAVPNYTNRFVRMSREQTLPWDAQSAAPAITVPTLMIHSERALAPALARKFFSQLAGPRQELWVESEGQIDFYDRPERIEPAADALAAHFDAIA